MGTLLRDSKKCRFCGEDIDHGLELFKGETMISKLYDKAEELETSVYISFSQASQKYLKLKLDPSSPFPRCTCYSCKVGLQNVISFNDKLEVGQVRLARILISEGGGEEVGELKKRGRPRKGFEKNKNETIFSLNENTQVGKRKIKLPKKFEETVHDMKSEVIDKTVDIEEKNADLEEYRLNIDEGDGNEEFTVSIDMSNLRETKAPPPPNPVLDEINSILTQFDKKEKEKVPEVTLTMFYCEICDQNFPSQECLDLHAGSSHGQIMYKCDLANCNALLKTKEELRTHQLNFGHEDFIILEIGNPKDPMKFSLSTDQDIVSMDGIIEKISDNFRCDQCDIDLDSQQKFNIHMAEIHGSHGTKVYPCTELGCNRSFAAPSSLTYHKFSSHNKSVYICTEPGCSKQFKIKNLLTRHLKTHSSERTFTCDECDKSFKTRSNLYSHTIVHQKEPKFFCDECGQQFKHRTSLTSHMRWHQGEKPFKCPFCSKSFNQNGNLQEHIRIHTGEKPFKCDLCPRSFTTSSQQKLHIKRHMGVKQFKCEYCEKAFLNKDTFKTHLRRHKGEKPFGCKFCKKAFAEAWALTKHLRFHTGQQPYLCKECGKRFSDSSNLAKHKKTHDEFLSKDKQTVWNIVKDAGGGIEELEGGGEAAGEEVQQVIYIAYENGDQKAIEGAIKNGRIDIAALAAQGIAVETEAGGEILAQDVEQQSGPLQKMEQMEYKEHLEPNTVKVVEHNEAVDQNNQTIDLTMKDGQQIRLVAPLNIDPLAFATEYFKDLQNLQN